MDYDLRKLQREFDEFKQEVSDRLKALEGGNGPASQENEAVATGKLTWKSKKTPKRLMR
jgi:hypothetical protein